MLASVENIVALKLGSGYEATEEIDLAIKQAEQTIKNYCNIDEVPEDLAFVCADMAVDIILGKGVPSLGDNLEAETSAPIKALTLGDMKIEYDNVAKEHTVNLDRLVMNYVDQLNGFRRMTW